MRPRLGAAWQPLSPRWSLDGERILSDGYVKFVSTPAPAWVADKLPIYGAFFWINGLGQYPVPRELLLHGRCGRADNDDRAIT